MSSLDTFAADAPTTSYESTLLATIRSHGALVVAFSGGVDSTVLLAAAAKALGPEHVTAVTADSASLATDELELCENLAAEIGVRWLPVKTNELDNPRYLTNAGDRCYWCKSALMDQLEPLATSLGSTPAKIALGVNLDDLGDHRPGQQAARERGAVFPLVEAEMSKSDIRSLAKAWDLPVWDRPAMPCLSSRVPYGTEISVTLLSKVDRAESALRALGFADVRVRHYGETARIEVPSADVSKAADLAATITSALQAIGYEYVTLDLAGLRSGNLNAALRDTANSTPVSNER